MPVRNANESVEARESRVVVSPSTGTKVALLVGAALLVAAAYFFWVPLTVPSSTGAPFGCSTAASPPTNVFAKASCGSVNKINQYRAIACLIAALIIGGGGTLLFGTERRTETMLAPVRRSSTRDEVDD